MLKHIFENRAYFLKTLNTFHKTTHPKCKTPHISCRIKHCTQNYTNTYQNQTKTLCPINYTPLSFIKSTLIFYGVLYVEGSAYTVKIVHVYKNMCRNTNILLLYLYFSPKQIGATFIHNTNYSKQKCECVKDKYRKRMHVFALFLSACQHKVKYLSFMHCI